MIEMAFLVHLRNHHHHHHHLGTIEIVVITDHLVEVVVHQEKSLVVTEIEIGTEIDDDHDQGKVSIKST